MRFMCNRVCEFNFSKNRKIITKFSVLTDEKKNIIKGFVLEYDGVFKAPLCKQEKKEDIHLEINFNLFNAQGDKLSREMQLDRDGISHIAGKYNETTKNIKFLIFKCRSGKTLYIGDPTEEETDKIVPFIFGSSKYQLKMMHIELINDQLAYIQPRYQLSTRKNENIDIQFDNLDEVFDTFKFLISKLSNDFIFICNNKLLKISNLSFLLYKSIKLRIISLDKVMSLILSQRIKGCNLVKNNSP